MAIKKILSPVDFSEASAGAARKAEELARSTGAELVLLHVLNEPAFALAEGNAYAPPTLLDDYEAAMRDKLSQFRESFAGSSVRVESKIMRGVPHEAIVHLAEKEHADLIVMSTHGRTGLSHLLLGSVAERVVRTAKMPVLTVRAPQGARAR